MAVSTKGYPSPHPSPLTPLHPAPRQVACGWNLTAALTRNGRVYQMGATGAYSPDDKSVPWEGALVPVQVDANLFGLFIEEVGSG